MLDSRFPSLERLKNWRSASKNAMWCAAQVESRTGTNAIVNVDSGRVIFRFGEESLGGPFGVNIRDMDRWTTGDVDSAVHLINYQRNAGRNEHDRELARQEKAEKDEKQKGIDQACEDARPDALSHAAYLSRERRGTQKVISTGPA